MRTGLLSELSMIGYEIFLHGDNIRLRYQKPESPPDKVKPLIDELRKHKAEAVKILKMGNDITLSKKSQPQTNVKASWPPDVQTLIDYFLALDQPTEPFYLEPHRKIVDPEKFFLSLRRDIKAGPDGPRGKHGILIHDIDKLKKIFH